MANKNVVVLVHGIGKHDAGWATQGEESPVETLKTASKKYDAIFPEDNPITNSVEFVEILYDDIFEAVRSQWNELATNLESAGFDGASASSVAKLKQFMPGAIGALAQVTDENKWVATHALDAILYKGFALIRNIIRHSVAAQLARIAADHIQEDRDDDPTYTLVGHSLGTAVLYDAIDLLGRTNWLNGVEKIQAEGLASDISEDGLRLARSRFGANPFSSKGLWDWHGLVMIANVSPIFCRHPKPDSIEARVRPIHSGGVNGRSLDYYFNIDHMFDPVPKFMRFSATATWPTSAQAGFAFDTVDLRHFYDKNIHGFSHYLIHPSVHSRIFWLATPNRFRFSAVRAADAGIGDEFPNLNPQFVDDAKRLVLEKALARIFDLTDQKEIDTYVARLNALADIIRGD